jgi:2-oxoglutarate ferredoxin oxidoreductase subunit alpha
MTNDFAFKIGTVNGTGSASANGLIMQAIFRMGIPVSGKNVFPSNIQGLPTWYEIRVNKHGYTARSSRFDLVVALNPATYQRDVAEIRPGGFLLYDSSWPIDAALRREGITLLGIPLGRLCGEAFEGDRERQLMRNIAYAGALVALLDIEMDVVEGMIREQFGRKRALLDSNFKALRIGYDFAKANFTCPLPFRLERMDATADYIIIDGNTAAALGCLYAGATVGAWYPITPATSLMEAFKALCEQYRVDKDTGRKRFCILQAEDELAAAGIVIGAGWAGARAFTPTAGPGISLMQEFIGLAYYTEIPGGVLRRAASRSIDRNADANAASRSPVSRVRLPRRHEAHRALSGKPGRMLLVRGACIRPCGAVSDARVRRIGPRYRDERLDVPTPEVG